MLNYISRVIQRRRKRRTAMEEDNNNNNNRNEMYRECLRNHAASLGSYATDGCGEFTSEDSSPSSLQCVACGCHRNFHRKVPYVATSPNDGVGGFRSRAGVIGGGMEVACGRDTMMAEPLDYGGGSRQVMTVSLEKKRNENGALTRNVGKNVRRFVLPSGYEFSGDGGVLDGERGEEEV